MEFSCKIDRHTGKTAGISDSFGMPRSGTLAKMVNSGVLMGSRLSVARSGDGSESATQSVVRFFVGASGLVLRGLGVAVLMGVVFGLLIGIGGLWLGVESEQQIIMGGLSGWISSFIAIMYIVLHVRRQRTAGH